MFLQDLGKSPNSAFRKINRLLEANYGFVISENVSSSELANIVRQIESEVYDLKLKGDDAKFSPEISKRLLILEGIRNLREFADLVSLRSPKLDQVIEALSNYVVEAFELSALHETSHDDFENAVGKAMEEYRSSKYRFPDDYVESRVRESAMNKLQQMDTMGESSAWDDLAGMKQSYSVVESVDDHAGPDPQWYLSGELEEIIDSAHTDEDWFSAVMDTDPFTDPSEAIKVCQSYLSRVRPNLAVMAFRTVNGMTPDEAYESFYDNTEWLIGVKDLSENRKEISDTVDPITNIGSKHSANIHEGSTMKENLVKNLRYLLETEVSQAEVMMAAKGFAQELQEMIEKIGRLQNEDLPPVTDQMRETYGTESASAFQTQIYGALQSVMDSLYSAKGQVDDAVSNMAETGQYSASIDMEKDLDLDTDGANPDVSGMDADIGDLDNIEDELQNADDFGADSAEEPLGRAKKNESRESMQLKVLEMRNLVDRARKLKESSRK